MTTGFITMLTFRLGCVLNVGDYRNSFSQKKGAAKMIQKSALLILLLLLISLLVPSNGFSLGDRPKKSTNSETIRIKPIQPQPSARDMQVSTGQIKPQNQESHSSE